MAAPPPVASDCSGADALEGFGPDVNHGTNGTLQKWVWNRMVPSKKNLHNLAWKMTVQTNWNLEDDLLEINRARKMGLEMGQENDVVPIVPFEHVFLVDFRRL